MIRLLLLLSLFAVGGCASAVLDKGLPRLKGQPLDTAIHYLGLPDREMTIAGRKTYVWEVSDIGSYVLPVTTTTNVNGYGAGGWGSAYATSTSYVPQTYHYQCAIKMTVSRKNIVNYIEYEGNEEGCFAFVDSIQRLIDDTEPTDHPKSGNGNTKKP